MQRKAGGGPVKVRVDNDTAGQRRNLGGQIEEDEEDGVGLGLVQQEQQEEEKWYVREKEEAKRTGTDWCLADDCVRCSRHPLVVVL